MNRQDIEGYILENYPQWEWLSSRLVHGDKSDWEDLVLKAFLSGACDVVSGRDESVFWKDVEAFSVENFLLVALEPSGVRWTSLGYWLLRIGFTRRWFEEKACAVFGLNRKLLTDEEFYDFFSFLILVSVASELRSKA